MADGTKSRELNWQTNALLIEMTTKIVCASTEALTRQGNIKESMPGFISVVFKALSDAAGGATMHAEATTKEPAVPIGKSVQKDYIVCLEDGKKFKSLKRHLSTEFNLTPDEYRVKWNLPSNYPMVAPNYSEARSKLAKASGLGKPRKAA